MTHHLPLHSVTAVHIIVPHSRAAAPPRPAHTFELVVGPTSICCSFGDVALSIKATHNCLQAPYGRRTYLHPPYARGGLPCRWANSQGGSPLASLPSEVLCTIVSKAGKEARLVCTALRHAFGAAGTGVYIPPSGLVSTPSCEQAEAVEAAATAAIKLHADTCLSYTTCHAVAQAFPRLQELTLQEGAASYATLAAGLTTLTALRTPWVSPVTRQIAYVHPFSMLRSLTLQFGPQFNGTIGTLSALQQLTGLALTSAPEAIICRRRGFDIGYGDDDADAGCEHDDGDDAIASQAAVAAAVAAAAAQAEAAAAADVAQVAVRRMEVWGMLAALPKLARLELDVIPNYHSDMPEVLLPCVTHLTLACDPSMVRRDNARGVEVPLVQVSVHTSPPLLGCHN
jgi:hypothetical protein